MKRARRLTNLIRFTGEASNVRIRVINESGTLCGSCDRATVTRYIGGLRIFCNAWEREMTSKVIECSKYRLKNAPDRYDLEKIAWILRTDPTRTKVGFVLPGTAEHKKLRGDD